LLSGCQFFALVSLLNGPGPKQPDALITLPQSRGLYGPLLYPTSITGTAGLTLDFTVVHPVSRRGTEYTFDENALHRAYRAN